MQISKEDYEKLVGQAKVADILNKQNKSMRGELEAAKKEIDSLAEINGYLRLEKEELESSVKSMEIKHKAIMQGVYSIIQNEINIYQ